jgi:superfamily I DNA and RNA helicase
MNDWEFIVTEFVGGPGEEGERYIWEAVAKALKGTGEGIAILNYTDFHHHNQIRYQPDILLISRDLGITVIEVKTIRIDEIVAIRANQWEMKKGFYARNISPTKQGENQLRQLLKRCDRKPELHNQIPGRVLVALPLIGRDEWRDRGFQDDHHTCPPIIFGDELSPRSVRDAIENSAIILQKGDTPLQLGDHHWKLLSGVIVGHVKIAHESPDPGVDRTEPSPQGKSAIPKRSVILAALQNWMSEIDLQQVKIGMQIPPGPQRIRGIAGSGKTLLLCQKAARMHIQHPDWDIALVFFTRSLYESIPGIVQQWLDYWSDGELKLDRESCKLKILHAWGAKDRLGLYSLLRDRAGMNATVSEKPTGSLTERLAAACKRLLSSGKVEPMFDAILIDEGQDLAVSDDWKYEDKQAIYWLAWESLRPISAGDKEFKRLIWAYDEAQSLDALGIPSYGEVFGSELGQSLSGYKSGPTYKGGISKSEVMKRCYRTPGSILIAAHALGMGLMRKVGMVSGFTTKPNWEQIGYTVEGNFTSGQQITLRRPPENSPNPIPQLWGHNPLEFEVYNDREQQLHALVEKIRVNLNHDGLQKSRDILIIVLGADQETDEQGSKLNLSSQQLQQQIANRLHNSGISYYVPGAKSSNCYPDRDQRNADRFWWVDAITVSRLYRAKGHEAPMVYILGLEFVAQDEGNVALRNQLFVALTRSMAWVHLSGIKDPDTHSDYLLYDEVRKVIQSGDTIRFTYQKPPKRNLSDEE